MSLSTVTKGLFLASAVALAPFAHAAATDAKIESNVIAIPAAPKASDVIATVGPYSFTWGELSQDVEMIFMMLEGDVPADQKSNLKEMARQRILQTFIVDSLVKIAAEKEKVVVSQAMREKALADFEREQGIPFDIALAQLSPVLANRNRQSFELRLLEMALLEEVVFKGLTIDDATLNAAMEEATSYRKEARDKLTTLHTNLANKTMTVEAAVQANPDFFSPQVYVEIQESQLSQLQFPPKSIEAITKTPEGALTEILTLTDDSLAFSIDNATIEGFFLVEKKPQANDKNDAKTAAKEKIAALKKQLDEGADFATLAKTASACPSSARGGDLGEFGRGVMVKPFEEAAFTQPIDVVGDIVETDFGYHLIKVTARDEVAGTVTASHILICPESAATSYKLVPVMTMLPVEASPEEVKAILLEQKKTEAATAYFETLRRETPITCTLYPNLAK